MSDLVRNPNCWFSHANTHYCIFFQLRQVGQMKGELKNIETESEEESEEEEEEEVQHKSQAK